MFYIHAIEMHKTLNVPLFLVGCAMVINHVLHGPYRQLYYVPLAAGHHFSHP